MKFGFKLWQLDYQLYNFILGQAFKGRKFMSM